MASSAQNDTDKQLNQAFEDNLLEREEYLSDKGKIAIPMGFCEDQTVLVSDLSTIPHILICGITGTGKTSFVQTVLALLISKQSPEEVKVVIYDAKRIEYGVFSGAPHLLMPMINDRSKAVSFLKDLTEEIQKRFNLLADSGCKDFRKYNAQPNLRKKLPELFVVLDDFSSLSLSTIEMQDLLCVLNNGRIAGIHLIVISSMDSRKVNQKELISNIPCKICFRTSSKTESKNILEKPGAEELFVPGEMIYKYQNDFYKCQSAYATYENIKNVMKSVCHACTSVSALGIEAANIFSYVQYETESNQDYLSDDYDDLLSNAAEYVINSRNASISAIQRRYGIGFARAARIIGQLQELGVVGAESWGQPRRVLMTVDDWNRMCSSKGIKRIYQENDSNSSTDIQSSYNSPTSFSEPASDAEKEPVIKLRDFAELQIGDTTISIHDDEIHFTKPIMTRFGKGYVTPTFSGSNVTGLIYKKPSLFSSGYITFEFDPKTKIVNNNPDLLQADENNISEIVKIVFKQGQDRMIKLLLQQLSEDIDVPITCL